MSAEARRRRCYLVCATQRSGSTLLCELLKSTGVAGRPEEYFEAERDTGAPPHPGRYLRGLARTGVGIRDDPAPPVAPGYSSLAGIGDYAEHLRRAFAEGTTDNGVFGAKLMFNQLPELHAHVAGVAPYAGLDDGALLAALFGEDARYIWLRREDTVRQAVSMWKALQSRRWRGGEGGGEAGRQPQPQYDFAAIDHLVGWFTDADAGWEAHFAEHGVEPLRLAYERDLLGDPEQTACRALDWIGVPAPAGWSAAAPMPRQADALSEAWVRRYDRDRE